MHRYLWLFIMGMLWLAACADDPVPRTLNSTIGFAPGTYFAHPNDLQVQFVGSAEAQDDEIFAHPLDSSSIVVSLSSQSTTNASMFGTGALTIQDEGTIAVSPILSPNPMKFVMRDEIRFGQDQILILENSPSAITGGAKVIVLGDISDDCPKTICSVQAVTSIVELATDPEWDYNIRLRVYSGQFPPGAFIQVKGPVRRYPEFMPNALLVCNNASYDEHGFPDCIVQ